MPSLVSPGVSVTIVDESFYIPAAAPTVPLFFVATQADKLQPNGVSPAEGTNEYGVIRTVTSIGQSVQLYGVPSFLKDASGNAFHGDARNEYGLFALNQYLGVGSYAYVIRANVDLADKPVEFITLGTPVAKSYTYVGVGGDILVNAAIGDYNGKITGPLGTGLPYAQSELIQPEQFTVVITNPATFASDGSLASEAEFTVTGSLSGIIGTGTVNTPFNGKVSFKVSIDRSVPHAEFIAGDYYAFTLEYAAVPTLAAPSAGKGTLGSLVTETGYNRPSLGSTETWTVTIGADLTSFTVTGTYHPTVSSGSVGSTFSNGNISFLISSGTTAFSAGDIFTITAARVMYANPLGANDAAKRATIAMALAQQITSNTEARSTDVFEYNLIVCPGYHEVVPQLADLSQQIGEEAFVIADTPCNRTPENIASYWAVSSERYRNTVDARAIAYYYPWGMTRNLDGAEVVVAPSGIAARAYAFNDNVAYCWFAPAGARRGVVTGISKIGYVSGDLGEATRFVECNLNQGQRDILYKAPSNINPIVNFPAQGMVIWGQKTSQTVASALDRVNVVRLCMYLKRALRKGAFPFVFEPNDQITRDNLKAAIDGLLNDVMSKRGLYDFVTISDESNNTAYRIDNNELWVDIAIKPVKAAEFIYIPIRVLSTGASMPG